MSRAILADGAARRTPSAPASSPTRARSVCQGSTGGSSSSSAASRASTCGRRAHRRQRAGGAAELDARRGARAAAARASSSAVIQPAALSPNVVGDGLLEQRAADHRRVAVRAGEALGRLVGGAVEVGADQRRSARLATSIAAVSRRPGSSRRGARARPSRALQRRSPAGRRGCRSRPRRADLGGSSGSAHAAAIGVGVASEITPARPPARAPGPPRSPASRPASPVGHGLGRAAARQDGAEQLRSEEDGLTLALQHDVEAVAVAVGLARPACRGAPRGTLSSTGRRRCPRRRSRCGSRRG